MMKPAFSWCCLASGSSGNALLVRGEKGSILFDMGLSIRELARRMHGVEAGLEELRALFVTHEHGDHIGGAGRLARRLGIPVYLSRGSSRASAKVWRGDELQVLIAAGETVDIAGFQVHAHPVSHDVQEPLHYRVEADGCALGILTDLGKSDHRTRAFLADLDSVHLEFNHDLELLRSGPYPWPLKKRVMGDYGHLSNEQAAELLKDIATDRLQHVSLAHLSEENNRPALAVEAAEKALQEAAVSPTFLGAAEPRTPGPWHHVTR
jgi:phosphoribosyl 1,2-cyclic phosphodiesterase